MSGAAAEAAGESLAEYFRPGIDPGDVAALFPLLQAREVVSSFSALFHGGLPGVLVRLVVLREIGNRAEAPEWAPRDLERHFAFLDATKLATVLQRLRDHGLLAWDAEQRLYRLSPTGRMVLSALSNLLAFAQEEDAELGFLAGQIAAGAAVGKLSAETLAHLLARLAELEEEFARAVASGSEFRLRTAQGKLKSLWPRMEQATEVLRTIAEAGFPDDASWRLAQEIGARQSRIMRMASVFQRELAQIARQRVHLGQGELTSSELAAWLKGRSADELAALAEGQLAAIPEPVFILPDVMADNAEEFTLRGRPGRRVSVMPPPSEAPATRDVPREPPRELAALTRLLAGIEVPLPVADAVVGDNFSAASYRLSLLAFLGERNVDPDLAPLADLPLAVRWDEASQELVPVARAEVAKMSAGRLVPVK